MVWDKWDLSSMTTRDILTVSATRKQGFYILAYYCANTRKCMLIVSKLNVTCVYPTQQQT